MQGLLFCKKNDKIRIPNIIRKDRFYQIRDGSHCLSISTIGRYSFTVSVSMLLAISRHFVNNSQHIRRQNTTEPVQEEGEA